MKQRTIKFRAWHVQDKVMQYPTELDTTKTTVIDLNGQVFLSTDDLQNNKGSLQVFFPEDIILMQFTGLLDKNGLEIYEGDTVQYQHVLGEKYWDNKEVKWSESLAGWVIDKRDSGLSVVIGNIYENPELLKV